MTIYIDVLLAVNLYINYFLIRGTAVLLRRNLPAKRCIAAAAVGALFSAAVLFPEMPFLVSVAVKMLSGVAIVFAAFGCIKGIDAIITVLCFLAISFLYAGAMLALWIFSAPFGMFYRNGVAYFNIPIIAVALITIMGYVALRLFRIFSDKKNIAAIEAEVAIKVSNNEMLLKGTADTGNGLCDPFSGKPVIICRLNAINEIIPENIMLYLSGNTDKLEGIRLVPCTTIAGHTLVPIFNAKVSVNGKDTDAVIGVTAKEIGTDCIINPKLII